MERFANEGILEPANLGPGSMRANSHQGRAGQARLLFVLEAAFSIGRDELGGRTRGRCSVALARQIGMYLARVSLGMTLSEAGELFGRDRTTASHACRLVEDLRDDQSFDALLQAMETILLHRSANAGRGAR